MKSFVSLLLVAIVAIVNPVGAQDARLTPYLGFLASGSIAEGPLGSRLVNRGAPLIGVQLALPVSSTVALVGNLGYADSELQAGFPLIGGLSFADSKVLMYDAALQLRFPATSRGGAGVVPFIEGGAGVIRHELTVGPVTTTSTNAAVIAGGGIDVQLGSALGVKFMARDHMSRFDFGEAIGLTNEGRRAHNWVLGVGLTLGR